MLSIALITTLFFGMKLHAAPGINQTIGFQGRLLDTKGDIVRDGYYNVQFKVYQGGAGEAAGNPGGTLKWTETYLNNGSATGAVEVKNGFLSVNLGSVNPFGTSVDWNDDTLWLSMNIAGSAASCTSFGSGTCAADGEMLPMKRMTATPYALNAGAVNGKTADNFIQLAQGVQTDATANTSSIFINKTSSGNLIQLQNTATDIFTVTNQGDVTLGSNASHSISIANSADGSDGKQLSINAGSGGDGTGSNGGTLTLQGGSAGGTNGNGGDISIEAGTKTGTGTNGTIAIGTAGASLTTIGAAGTAESGATVLQAKEAVTIKTDGTTRATFSDSSNTVYFGNGVSASAPTDFTLQGTNSSSAGVAGGTLSLQGGSATTGDTNGGNITLGGGEGSGSGATGLVVLNTPTFSTVSNDANCYTDGAVVAASCAVTTNSINNAAAVIVGFSTAGQTATIPDPTITTAGRIMYITAADASTDFTLSMNSGGAGSTTTLKKNTTATLLWNGADWTIAGGTNYGINTTDAVDTIQIGSGTDDGQTTLLTVDRAGSAPTSTDAALLGSMYYDTTVGKLQCFEADGWGACSSSPDSFVTLSPEYSNAVKNGNGIGTMSSDVCSDTLDINDGTNDQAEVCGTNETYNYYNWTSSEAAEQKRSIYVTYQLPTNFKQFVAGSTSLMAKTDSNNANVNYQVYKNTGSGLVACGTAVQTSTGLQTTWQKAAGSGTTDPSNCGFAAGDSVVFRINMSAHDEANTYVSNLQFAFSNN